MTKPKRYGPPDGTTEKLVKGFVVLCRDNPIFAAFISILVAFVYMFREKQDFLIYLAQQGKFGYPNVWVAACLTLGLSVIFSERRGRARCEEERVIDRKHFNGVIKALAEKAKSDQRETLMRQNAMGKVLVQAANALSRVNQPPRALIDAIDVELDENALTSEYDSIIAKTIDPAD